MSAMPSPFTSASSRGNSSWLVQPPPSGRSECASRSVAPKLPPPVASATYARHCRSPRCRPGRRRSRRRARARMVLADPAIGGFRIAQAGRWAPQITAAGRERRQRPAVAEADDVGQPVAVHVGEFARVLAKLVQPLSLPNSRNPEGQPVKKRRRHVKYSIVELKTLNSAQRIDAVGPGYPKGPVVQLRKAGRPCDCLGTPRCRCQYRHRGCRCRGRRLSDPHLRARGYGRSLTKPPRPRQHRFRSGYRRARSPEAAHISNKQPSFHRFRER